MKNYNEIMQEPLSGFRVELLQALRTKSFDQNALANFFARMSEAFLTVSFHNELDIIRNTRPGNSVVLPDLKSDETQLAWAAKLAHLYLEGEKAEIPAHQTYLWQSIQNSPYLNAELATSGQYVVAHVPRHTLIRWGVPGSWFYFMEEDKDQSRDPVINIDLLYSLTLGLRNSRAIMMHEISHAEITEAWPPSIMQLKDQGKKIVADYKRQKAANSDHKMPRATYAHLLRLDAEAQIHAQFFNATEDNATNRLTVHAGQDFAYDFGDSLNHVEALLISAGMAMGAFKRDFSLDRLVPTDLKDLEGLKGPIDPQANMKQKMRDLQTLNGLANFSFFVVNGLFEPDHNGLDSVGMDRHSIINVLGSDERPVIEAMMQKYDGTISSYSHYQPQLIEGVRGFLVRASRDVLSNIMDVNPVNRQRVMLSDQLWAEYAAPIASDLFEQFEKTALQRLEQKSKQHDQKDGSKRQSQQKDQSQNGGSGTPDLTNPQNGSGDGEMIEIEGMEPQPNANSVPDKPYGHGKSDRLENKVEKPPSASEREKDQSNKPENKQRNAETPDEGGKKKTGAGLDNQNKNNGGVADSDTPTANDIDPAADESSRGMRLADLLEEANAHHVDQDSFYRDMRDATQRLLQQNSPLAPSIDNLPPGDWNNYLATVAALEPHIQSFQQKLAAALKIQSTPKRIKSHSYELLPSDGNIGRFDMRRQIRLQVKHSTGARPTRSDYERFSTDEMRSIAAKPIFGLLTDGSGSMGIGNIGGKKPIDAAMIADVVIYEACERMNIPCYAGIWGPSNPQMLARPGEDRFKVGENIDKFMKGLNSTTYLFPALIMLTQEASTLHQSINVGYFHIAIISDGDIFDAPTAKKCLTVMMRELPELTVDVLVLNSNRNNNMERMIRELTAETGDYRRISVYEGFDPDLLASNVINNIEARLLNAPALPVRPYNEKRMQFMRAHQVIKDIRI